MQKKVHFINIAMQIDLTSSAHLNLPPYLLQL